MLTVDQGSPASVSDARMISGVPVRDLVIMPIISLLTIIFMIGTAEIVTRTLWPEQSFDACEIVTSNDVIFKKGCKSRTKIAESAWVQNSYNDCGYRTRESCGPKKPNTIRVAVVGSSVSYGYMNPYEQGYPALTSAALTRQCKRPVEFQNTGAPLIKMINVYQHFDEALALKPDMAIFTFSPFDVQVNDLTPEQREHLDTASLNPRTPLTATPQNNPFKRYILMPLKGSRSVYMLQHQLYQDPATYVKLYMLYGDNGSGYLKATFSPGWQAKFENLDAIIAGLSRKAQAASVPLAIFVAPSAAQVALQSTPRRDGTDPEAFTREVRRIASRYGVQVMDALPQMAQQKNPMSLFYVVDGHVGPAGQASMAAALDSELISPRFPVFAGCRTN